MIYIIIPTYNRVEVCNNFINQLKNQTYQDFKVILIDHGSIKTGIPSSDKITVLQSNVNGWAKAINIGLRFIMDKEKTNDDYVLIINDDVTIENDYLLNVHQSILEKPEAILGTCCINEKNNKTLRVAIKINKLKAKNIYISKYIL